MTWRDAHSIDVLADEINTAYPDRSKASDGTIGDAAHASRESDHNPWVILDGIGIVRARDVTHDPAHGCDCDVLAERIAGLIALGAHPALRHGAYVIRNRRIFSFDHRDEGWRPYTGSNPHEKHMHVSVSLDPIGFDSTAHWGITEEEDVVDDATIDKIADRAVEKLLGKKLGNGLTVQANLRKAGDTKELAKEIAQELSKTASQGARRGQA